jgi:prepilin-type N-terminal cleavage/methylation domain-containing protein
MRYNKGFTLIEVFVAVAIASTVLIGITRLYCLGGIQSTVVKHKMMALSLAQAEIENLKNMEYEGIMTSNYPLTQVVKIDTGRNTSTTDDLDGTMVTRIVNGTEGYKAIVTVMWNDYYGTINEVMEVLIVSYR